MITEDARRELADVLSKYFSRDGQRRAEQKEIANLKSWMRGAIESESFSEEMPNEIWNLVRLMDEEETMVGVKARMKEIGSLLERERASGTVDGDIRKMDGEVITEEEGGEE